MTIDINDDCTTKTDSRLNSLVTASIGISKYKVVLIFYRSVTT